MSKRDLAAIRYKQFEFEIPSGSYPLTFDVRPLTVLNLEQNLEPVNLELANALLIRSPTSNQIAVQTFDVQTFDLRHLLMSGFQARTTPLERIS